MLTDNTTTVMEHTHPEDLLLNIFQMRSSDSLSPLQPPPPVNDANQVVFESIKTVIDSCKAATAASSTDPIHVSGPTQSHRTSQTREAGRGAGHGHGCGHGVDEVRTVAHEQGHTIGMGHGQTVN